MEIIIDKNIPIPYKHYLGGSKYPFHKLEVGDSFLLPDSIGAKAFRTSATQYGKRHNMKFLTRKVENGVRIWRTE